MAKIEPQNLSKLLSASELKTVYKNSESDSELQSITIAINTAANAGQRSIYINHILSQDCISTLKSKGYKLNKLGRLMIISW